jgi:prepilin-type N-terminal cleavage/methylation domain-containing protein
MFAFDLNAMKTKAERRVDDMRNVFSAWRAIPRGAFTLIELLIVVAIIAILAAIAVPNFLEAQTRSKVSRAQADFRTLATAIESYFVDHNGYAYDQDDNPNSGPTEDGFRLLTTPISYFSSGRSLSDPFSNSRLTNNNEAAPHYQMATGVDPARRSPARTPISDPAYAPVQAWAVFSSGPAPQDGPGDEDSVMANDDWPFRPIGTTLPHLLGVRAFYDPSNGTLSFGGIFRFGGDYSAGNWVIQTDPPGPEIPHNAWGIKASYP